VTDSVPTPPNQRGVYTDLDELVRLQYQARGFSYLPRQPLHSVLAGRHGSRLRGRGFDFEEIRHYRPGDDPRSFDWKVTARLRAPHVRVFTEERDRPAIVAVDQRSSMFFGSELQMKSVTAAEAAALSVWRVLAQGDRVGAVVFSDDELVEVRPQRSQRNALHILRELTRCNRKLPGQVESQPRQLNEVLERIARLAKHDALVTVISDFAGADDETRRWMTRIARHNDVVVVFVYDRFEQRLPQAGRLVFADGDLQLEVDTADPRLCERFEQRFTDRLERTRAFLLQRAVPVIPVHTGGDVAAQARAQLGMARSRRRR